MLLYEEDRLRLEKAQRLETSHLLPLGLGSFQEKLR